MRLSLLTALATTALAAPSPAPVDDPVVAVVDTGVALARPAFAWGGVWTDPATGVHGVSFDKGGGGHGTAVAGLVSGHTPGGRPYGVAGVGQVMALSFGARPYTSAVADAIEYAVGHGARIVNASFTGPLGAADGVIRAHPDVLFVAGAGNDRADDDAVPSEYWPCTSGAPNVICVAAADKHGDPARFTNRGASTVDLAAAGTRLRTVGQRRFTGTSAATPVVTGAVAYLWSLAPQASAAQIKRVLLETARPRRSWAGKTVTGGVLDVRAAAEALTGLPLVDLPRSVNAARF
jgi:subtilisin family serine protease